MTAARVVVGSGSVAGAGRLLAVGVALALASASSNLAAIAADAPDAGMDREGRVRIESWVADLNADSFTTREIATQRLIEAGRAAVAPVAAAASGAGLEVATRAIHILRELAVSSDGPTEEAARQALTDLAADRVTAAARRAAAALAMLDQVRQERAISELRRLGASVRRTLVRFGLQTVDNTLEIEIGDKWRGSPEDLRRLAWLKDRQNVTLRGPQVKGAWLKQVGRMSNLVRLVLHEVSVRDDALAYLAPLTRLRELQVRYTPIGDGALKFLRTGRSLSDIKLYGTAVSREGAEELARALPDANVDYRTGGFLGVGCVKHALGCEVAFVQPGSAAAKAGLRQHDVIVKYDGSATTDPERLTQLVGVDPVGHAATVELIRGGKTETVAITLGQYDE